MKWIKSFAYAWKGIVYAFKSERNLRIHFFVSVCVIVSGFYFSINANEWLIILIMISIVISLELINTSIEKLTDLVSKENNPLAGKVKDIAAAAVLFSAMVAVIVGVVIFSNHIFHELD